MKRVMVAVVKSAGGELFLQFQDKKLKKRPIICQNIDQMEITENDIWWASIDESVESPQHRGSEPLKISLISKIVVPKLDIVDSIPDFWIDPIKLRHIQILLLNSKDVMLIGHKGTGKTDLVHKLSKVWDCRFCKVDCGTLQTPSSLFGFEAAEKGATIWRPSLFWSFVQDAIHNPDVKFLLLLDEINRMHSKMAEGFHGLYDFTRQVSFITSEGTKVLKMPSNIMTVATRNAGEQYTATYRMDAALIDRFVQIQMEYLSKEVEIDILINKHGIYPKQAEIIVNVANSLRIAESKGVLPASPSPRMTDAAAVLVKYGESVAAALETAFLGLYDQGIAIAGLNGDKSSDETEKDQARAHISKFIKDIVPALV